MKKFKCKYLEKYATKFHGTKDTGIANEYVIRWPRRVSRRGRPPTGREVGRREPPQAARSGRREPRGSRLRLIGAKYRNKGCGITHLYMYF